MVSLKNLAADALYWTPVNGAPAPAVVGILPSPIPKIRSTVRLADAMRLFALSSDLGETVPLSQWFQARRKALRIRHINGMEVRSKRPRRFK